MDYIAILQAVGYAAAMAAVAAGVGYFKGHFKRKPGEVFTPESFDYVKFLRTVLIGTIIGAAAGFYGVPLVDAELLLETVGFLPAIIYFVDAAAVSLVRFVRAKLKI